MSGKRFCNFIIESKILLPWVIFEHGELGSKPILLFNISANRPPGVIFPHVPITIAVVINIYRYLVCVPHLCIRNTRMKGSTRPLLGHLFLGNTINGVPPLLPILWQLLTGGQDPALGQFCSLLEAL